MEYSFCLFYLLYRWSMRRQGYVAWWTTCVTALTAEAHSMPQNGADWRGGSGKAWRSAQSFSYPAVAAVSAAHFWSGNQIILSAGKRRAASDAIVASFVSVISTWSRRRSLFAVRLNVLIIIARRKRYWVAGHAELRSPCGARVF